MKYIYFLIFVTIIFLFYVEYSVGNVIYRVTADGSKKIIIRRILYFLIEPFTNPFLWYLNVLDLNYIFILTLSTIIYQNIIVINLNQ
jgi:hypothetical protein